MRLISHLPTERAAALIQTAAKHFAHKVTVEQADGVARIAFPAGLGTMTADGTGIVLTIDSDDAAAAERVRGVLEGHLLRFAHREAPQPLVWIEG